MDCGNTSGWKMNLEMCGGGGDVYDDTSSMCSSSDSPTQVNTLMMM